MDALKVRASAAAEVRVFCESVSDSTASSITLLKAIEQTVDWLTWLQTRAKADARFAAKAAEHLKSCERIKPVDVDGTLATLFEEAEESLEKLHQLLINKRDFARKAPELKGDNKAAVVDGYSAAIEAIADLHNAMVDLRWAFGEHDADLEEPTGPAISNSDGLRAYLASL